MLTCSNIILAIVSNYFKYSAMILPVTVAIISGIMILMILWKKPCRVTWASDMVCLGFIFSGMSALCEIIFKEQNSTGQSWWHILAVALSCVAFLVARCIDNYPFGNSALNRMSESDRKAIVERQENPM